jgi:imidazolonepropionase-like amidohydrolase
MNRIYWLVASLLIAGPSLAASVDPTTAFVHVNVVPMDRERTLRDQTVLVRGDRIVAVGSDVAIPSGAERVDGHGKAWLSPGLADMHTHSQTKNDLAIYLAHGVTSVLNMGDAHAGFIDTTVPAANRGAIPSPHVYMSFLVDGNTDYNGFVVKTPDEARAIVGLAKTNGYDFMKVYVGLAPDTFDALADEGRKLGIPLVGHGVRSVRLERELAEGQVLVAHLEEFFYTFFTPRGVEESDTPPDDARIGDAVALAKKYDATVTADLATYAAIAHQIGHPELVDAFLARDAAFEISPDMRLAWQKSGYVAKTAKLEAKLAFLGRLVKAMADANVRLVAGTDAPAVPGMLPGTSLLDDLDALEGAGLSRYEALSTATREPGEFIERTKHGVPFGIVREGSRADLILTQENPLDGLSTLRKPLGVMAAGHWRDAKEIDELRRGVREAYRRASKGY